MWKNRIPQYASVTCPAQTSSAVLYRAKQGKTEDASQAIDEIKEIGQFAFEGTDRYQTYVSEFYRQAALAAARARRARAQEDGATAM